MKRDFFYLIKDNVSLKDLNDIIISMGYDSKLYDDRFGNELRVNFAVDGNKYYAEIKLYDDTFDDAPECSQFILRHQFKSIIFVHFQIGAFEDVMKAMKNIMSKYGGYVGSAINDGFLPRYNIKKKIPL